MPAITAAQQGQKERKTEIADYTYRKEKQLLAKPKDFFGSMIVKRIQSQHLLSYRAERVDSGVGPVIINMKMSAIGRLLRRARRWQHAAADIKPLKQTASGIGRVLTPEQKKKLLEVARSKPEWLAVRCAIELALNTTMRGGE